MTLEYQVAQGTTPHELQQAVTALIAEDWIPQGGVAVAVVRHDYKTRDGYEETDWDVTFAQAMVKSPPLR